MKSLFLVPTVFPKSRFHNATPTSVTFKEGAHQSWGPISSLQGVPCRTVSLIKPLVDKSVGVFLYQSLSYKFF